MALNASRSTPDKRIETSSRRPDAVGQVELKSVSKRYGREVVAVDSVDLAIEPGEFFTLLGPSGSGKTTLLRLISGLETPDSGGVHIAGTNVNRLPPRARDVAMVFQTPALYPYLSVGENLAFPLRARKSAGSEVNSRVEGVARTLGLSALLKRKPEALSGGERQRVALGRAIVRRPSVYLLDEPFSSLDAPLRASLRANLMEFHRSSNATMILVTHDQAEALALSDRIGLMNKGKLIQVDTPRALYQRPSNRFVAGFLGNPSMNLLVQKVEEGKPLILGPAHRPTRLAFNLPIAPSNQSGTEVDLGLRPEDIVLASSREAMTRNQVTLSQSAIVDRVEYLGNGSVVYAKMGADMICIRLDSAMIAPRPGEECQLAFELANAHWFERETGQRIRTNDGPFVDSRESLDC